MSMGTNTTDLSAGCRTRVKLAQPIVVTCVQVAYRVEDVKKTLQNFIPAHTLPRSSRRTLASTPS